MNNSIKILNIPYIEVETLTIYYPDHTFKTLQIGNPYFWRSPHIKMFYIGISTTDNNVVNVYIKFFYKDNPVEIIERGFVLIGGLIFAELKTKELDTNK